MTDSPTSSLLLELPLELSHQIVRNLTSIEDVLNFIESCPEHRMIAWDAIQVLEDDPHNLSAPITIDKIVRYVGEGDPSKMALTTLKGVELNSILDIPNLLQFPQAHNFVFYSVHSLVIPFLVSYLSVHFFLRSSRC